MQLLISSAEKQHFRHCTLPLRQRKKVAFFSTAKKTWATLHSHLIFCENQITALSLSHSKLSSALNFSFHSGFLFLKHHSIWLQTFKRCVKTICQTPTKKMVEWLLIPGRIYFVDTIKRGVQTLQIISRCLQESEYIKRLKFYFSFY